MLFAEITLTEAMAVGSPIVVALAGVVVYLWKRYDDNRSAQLKEMTEQRDSYRELGHEATKNLEHIRDHNLHKGQVPIPAILAPVVPEHNSPTTAKQRDAAELQTARARLVAITKALGLPAREAAPMEEESGKTGLGIKS